MTAFDEMAREFHAKFGCSDYLCAGINSDCGGHSAGTDEIKQWIFGKFAPMLLSDTIPFADCGHGASEGYAQGWNDANKAQKVWLALAVKDCQRIAEEGK